MHRKRILTRSHLHGINIKKASQALCFSQLRNETQKKLHYLGHRTTLSLAHTLKGKTSVGQFLQSRNLPAIQTALSVQIPTFLQMSLSTRIFHQDLLQVLIYPNKWRKIATGRSQECTSMASIWSLIHCKIRNRSKPIMKWLRLSSRSVSRLLQFQVQANTMSKGRLVTTRLSSLYCGQKCQIHSERAKARSTSTS